MTPRAVPEDSRPTGRRNRAVSAGDPDLVATLRRARSVLVLTGAGVSIASGLRPFRGPGGLYEGTDIEALHHTDHLAGNLERLWAFWGPLRTQVAGAEPNPAHEAIAVWHVAATGSGAEFTLATTNVDDLHERAGSAPVAHLHGPSIPPRQSTTASSATSPPPPSVRCPRWSPPPSAEMALSGPARPRRRR